MNKLSTTVLLFLLLTSCSNKEERSKALRELDATQQNLINVKTEIENLEKSLTDHLSELEVAKDDINQVKQFQFLRTEVEREQQIRKTTERRLKIEKNIETLQSNIEFFKDSVFRTELEISRLTEFLKN